MYLLLSLNQLIFYLTLKCQLDIITVYFLCGKKTAQEISTLSYLRATLVKSTIIMSGVQTLDRSQSTLSCAATLSVTRREFTQLPVLSYLG